MSLSWEISCKTLRTGKRFHLLCLYVFELSFVLLSKELMPRLTCNPSAVPGLSGLVSVTTSLASLTWSVTSNLTWTSTMMSLHLPWLASHTWNLLPMLTSTHRWFTLFICLFCFVKSLTLSFLSHLVKDQPVLYQPLCPISTVISLVKLPRSSPSTIALVMFTLPLMILLPSRCMLRLAELITMVNMVQMISGRPTTDLTWSSTWRSCGEVSKWYLSSYPLVRCRSRMIYIRMEFWKLLLTLRNLSL